MIYQYKYRATVYPVPAQVAGEYLQEVAERENGITAERLLELSRDKDALLHKCFTWDNTKAAEKYRIYESRQFIGNIVTVAINEKPVEEQRAFVSITETAHAEKGIFKLIITALSSEDTRQIVLKNAMRDWQIFKDKYKGLNELTKAIQAFDKEMSA